MEINGRDIQAIETIDFILIETNNVDNKTNHNSINNEFDNTINSFDTYNSTTRLRFALNALLATSMYTIDMTKRREED